MVQTVYPDALDSLTTLPKRNQTTSKIGLIDSTDLSTS
jgi:hypothetical protein